MPSKIFISYRREDSAANALSIGQYLEHEFGRKYVFIDVDMHAGAKFPVVLEERLSECKVMLVLIGPGWLNAKDEQGRRRLDLADDWVRLEIAHALRRNITVIPVRVNGADLPTRSALPDDIRGLLFHQAVSVTVSGFRHEMSGLAKDIRSIPGPRIWRRYGAFAAGLALVVLIALGLTYGAATGVFGRIQLLLFAKNEASPTQKGIWTSSGEWALFAINNQSTPYYFQPSSVSPLGDTVIYTTRFPMRSANPSGPTDKVFPQPAYEDGVTVLDCKRAMFALTERTVYNSSGETISHFKYGDPQSLIVTGQPIGPGSILSIAHKIVCDETLRTPILAKGQLANLKLSYLSVSPNGDGDIYYGPTKEISDSGYRYRLLTVLKYHQDHRFEELFPQNKDPFGLPASYRYFAQYLELNCTERKVQSVKIDNFDSDGNLIYVNAPLVVQPFAVNEGSPFALLLNLACGAAIPNVGGTYVGTNTTIYKRGPQGEQNISVIVAQTGNEVKVTFQTALGEQGKGVGTLKGTRVEALSLQSEVAGCPAKYEASIDFSGDTVSWSFKGEDCSGPMEGRGSAKRSKS